MKDKETIHSFNIKKESSMNHHIFKVFTAAAVLLPGILFSGENLLKNGTIEELKNGNPLPWTQSRNGTSSASVVQEGSNHRLHLKKVNDGKSTHTAWAQNVPVKPDTQYRLSGVAEGDGRGALAVGDILFEKESNHRFSLAWEWPAEGNDGEDTEIGSAGGEITLTITVTAQIAEESGV